MGSLVLRECFSCLALNTSMVNRFCFGVPFGFGTCFGLLIIVILLVRERLGFLIAIGVVRSDFQVSVYHAGALLFFRGDVHGACLSAFGDVLNLAMVALYLAFELFEDVLHT